jgi:hypothetical protein
MAGGGKVGILKELMVFLWKARLWWMIPIVLVLILLGILIIFGQSTGLAPFIYPFF